MEDERFASAKAARRLQKLEERREELQKREDVKKRYMERYRKKHRKRLLAEGRKRRAEQSASPVEQAAAELQRIEERELPKAQREVSEAEKELAMRILSRRRLLPFVMRFKPGYKAGWVHREICNALEWFAAEIEAERSPRLIITLPPRSGKSELASVGFPAWYLGRNPSHEVISCSHTASLAGQFSRRVRDILRDKAYQSIFDTRLDADSQSVEQWSTTLGGGYVAAGVGGAIVGKGAHALLIDDPVKNREQADSQAEREAAMAWYSSVAYTRLAPGGGVLLMLQRWHEDDLAGWQLKEMQAGGDTWRVLNFPAIALEDEKYRKKGEALHPERYDLKALQRIKRVMLPRDWEALYQQRPIADEGSYFKRQHFKYYPADALPTRLRYYAAWDLAIGLKESNDFTVGVVFGIDDNENMYLVDVVRGKWDSFEIVEKILDTYQRWRPDVVGIEKGQIELAIGPLLDKRMDERRLTGMYVEKLPPGRRDKFSRARVMQGRMQQGKVHFPVDAPWLQDLVYELLAFGGGAAHDDIVDAFAWIGLMLTEIAPPRVEKPETPESWKDKIRGFVAGARHKTAMAA